MKLESKISQKDIGIYAIINNINGKIYIGGSKYGIMNRRYRHRRDLRKGLHTNKYLTEDWNKYGEDAFSFKIIERCEKKMVDKREAFYVKKYNSNNLKIGYNYMSLKFFKFKTNRHKDEIKRMSERKKKKAINVDGFDSSERGINKRIKCYDLFGNFIAEYASGKEFQEKTGYSRHILCAKLRKGNHRYKEMIVLYSKDEITKEIIQKFNYKEKEIYRYNAYDFNMNVVFSNKTAKEMEKATGCSDLIISRSARGITKNRKYIFKRING